MGEALLSGPVSIVVVVYSLAEVQAITAFTYLVVLNRRSDEYVPDERRQSEPESGGRPGRRRKRCRWRRGRGRL